MNAFYPNRFTPYHTILAFIPHSILSTIGFPYSHIFFFRLQQKYIEVPGTVSVGVKDVYKLHSENIPPGTKHNALSQHQVGAIVPKLFPNIKVVRKNDGYVYEGLRLNFLEDKDCDINEINTIATENAFFNMNVSDDLKYGFMTGQCVNKIEIMKVLQINSDKTWKLFVAGKEVDTSIIGLSSVACHSYQSVAIIFRTARLSRICRGKPVSRKHSSRRYGYVFGVTFFDVYLSNPLPRNVLSFFIIWSM